jgi:ubiquitin-activating enzyme E1
MSSQMESISKITLNEQYDRQTRTYGIDAVNYLKNANVYIVSPYYELAFEIIKNLVLTGVQNIFIMESSDTDFKMKKSFYIDLEKNNYIVQIKDYVKDLNPSININTFNSYDTVIEKSVIVITNKTFTEINDNHSLKSLRDKKCKMVFGWDNHYSGCVYTDAGNCHNVKQPNDMVFESKKVDRIIDTTIFVENHGYLNGDVVSFNNLEGECSYLIGKEFHVFNSQKDSFQIDLVEPVKFINGFVKKEHDHINIIHKSIWDSEEREIMSFDIDKSNSIIDSLINTEYNNYCYPIISIIGGVVSAEVIKLVTYKYTPISQWFEFHDENIKNFNSDISQINIQDLNILMVGCGALGCEWLKNLMMIGIKNIDVTDPDHIEISNLSRQFLFRNKDVKESKSTVACNYIKNKDISMNLKPYLSKLGKENMDIVNELFDDKNIIINALDNLTARRFVDSICFERSLPLFESGTMGMKGNTQPIIPYLTETYSDSNDPSDTDSFPVCTIKNFPNKIEHTIHWARDYFEIFERAFRTIIKFNEDKSYLTTLSHFDKNQAIDDINMFCKTEIDDWTDCLYIAKELFDKNYQTEIKQLLYCYPKDHMVNEELFWSNGKRCPTIYTHYYGSNILDFLESTTNILINIYGLVNQEFTREDMMQLVLDFMIPIFKPDENKKIAKNDKELKEMTIENKDSELLSQLYFKDHYFPQTFEKDDDTNWHVKWITSASNCRAEIYNIEPATEFKTKGIAGKIIPAVATTTSTIVGLITIELMKFIVNKKSIEDYKSYFVNLSDNTFIGADPMDARIIKIGDKEFNQWDKLNFTVNKNSTINDFINFFNKKLDINIETICLDSSIIYSEMLGGDKNDNLLSSIREYTEDTEVQLILMDDQENEIPNIKVVI